MNIMTLIMLCFSLLGALDRIIGNRFGLGKEFERGFMLFGNMALSMIGMISVAPVIASALSPVFTFLSDVVHIEPSILSASLLANDMGGASLSEEIAANAQLGRFNALVVASMMGATVSYTIPYSLSAVSSSRHGELLLGILCGIVTVPIGCAVSGLMLGLSVLSVALDLLPLIIFSVLLCVALIKVPDVCIKVFKWFGVFIKTLITAGLALAIFKYLSGRELIKGMATLEEGAMICVNAAVVMSGAFPLIYTLSKFFAKPLKRLGEKTGMNETSALGFISTLATNVTTFEMMDKMDKKGAVLNSAFAVSAAFTFAGHLAFTMAFDRSYIFPVIIGKLSAGITALPVAFLLYKAKYGKCEKE